MEWFLAKIILDHAHDSCAIEKGERVEQLLVFGRRGFIFEQFQSIVLGLYVDRVESRHGVK